MKENLGKKVKELNARIEEIRDQRTRAETRKETLLGQLNGQIKEYEKLYGIKLSGKGYSGVEKAISGEMDRVSKEIQKEYELKVSVVEAIDSGNIDEAFRLLGMENPNKAPEEDVEDVVDSEGNGDGVELVDDGEEDQPTDAEYEEDVAKMGKKSGGKQSGRQGKQSGKQSKQGTNSVSLNAQSAEEVFDEFNGDDDDEGFGLDGFEFDDPDDEDTDDYAGPTGKTAKSTGNSSSDLGGFGIEFDDDDDDDDFGFGDILSGSKFE